LAGEVVGGDDGAKLLEPKFHRFSASTPGEKLGSLFFSSLYRNRALKVFHGAVGVLGVTSTARATRVVSAVLRYRELGSSEQQKRCRPGCESAHGPTSFVTSVVRLPRSGDGEAAEAEVELVRRFRSRLADVGDFADRLPAELLLVVDVAGGGVELVMTQQGESV
jgi:hypothetical protein